MISFEISIFIYCNTILWSYTLYVFLEINIFINFLKNNKNKDVKECNRNKKDFIILPRGNEKCESMCSLLFEKIN